MTKLLLRIIISSSLISWVLIYKVNFSVLLDVFAEADLKLLILAFSMHSLGFLFSALRWQKLLESQEIYVKLMPLIDSYIIGCFFNFFMPTRVGGDVVRVSDLRQASKSLSRSASSVFIERFLGITVLLCFALIASLMRLPIAQKIPAIWFGLAIGLLGLGLILISLHLSFIRQLLCLIPRLKLRDNLLTEWEIFRDNAVLLLSRKETLAWGLWYSFLLQINVVIHFWILGQALGFDIPLLDYFFLIPVQLVILMLPTIYGIGLREASGIVLFGYYGIAPTAAVTFGLLDFAMTFAIGIIGGYRFMVRRSIPQNINSYSSSGT